MPLIKPAVQFSRNGLFIRIPINSPMYKNYDESWVVVKGILRVFNELLPIKTFLLALFPSFCILFCIPSKF